MKPENYSFLINLQNYVLIVVLRTIYDFRFIIKKKICKFKIKNLYLFVIE
ncbi:unnamed protein product [marine sediment metagenome]|uniref:Uncharacterized protein n=1 Tax=marine sediment metagenome TaxID=412755 RepID=X1NH15_9ZZZZ